MRQMTFLFLLAACGTADEPTVGIERQPIGAVRDFRHVRGARQLRATGLGPPSDALCLQFGFRCFTPQELQRDYGVSALLDAGFDGKDQTVVIIDSFGSPTIAEDLRQYDADFGLPGPPSFQVLAPLGSVPFDPSSDEMLGWALET